MIELLSPSHWKDYELLDCGDFEKLERFGEVILIRPEPQAVWAKALPEADWTKLHHIRFKGKSATSGEWVKKNAKSPDRWNIAYKNEDIAIKFRLGLTSFKHVGIFPEQAVNWDFIAQQVKRFKNPEPKILNIFAYTKIDKFNSSILTIVQYISWLYISMTNFTRMYISNSIQ